MTRGRFWIPSGPPDKKKMTAKLKSVKAELMRKRTPRPRAGKVVASVIAGHQAYYAVLRDAKAVGAFRHRVIRHWPHALGRRSQKGG